MGVGVIGRGQQQHEARPYEGVPQARLPAEERGLRRDEVRLLLSSEDGHSHWRFHDLPGLLRPDDILVVNRSATMPAALPARLHDEELLLHLSTRFGARLWLAELRRSPADPGPVPLLTGQRLAVAGSTATVVGSYPGIPRLRFLSFDADPLELMSRSGKPIRYGYLERELPLDYYQTVFADRPGSAEMPSAARPFTRRTVAELHARGVRVARITLHTGVSSLEAQDLETGELYPEHFEIDHDSAAMLNEARSRGTRIIAVGTTVVRALASGWNGTEFRAIRGMTSLFVRRGVALPPISGLLTGLHDPFATHLAMLEALAGRHLVTAGYREAVAQDYLWHEFGDLHLLLPGNRLRQ